MGQEKRLRTVRHGRQDPYDEVLGLIAARQMGAASRAIG